jgi:hypothetical protein
LPVQRKRPLKRRPGYDAQFEVGLKPVLDPESAMPPKGDSADYKKRWVPHNLRETPIAHLRHRGHIDDRDVLAADKFRAMMEAARLSSAGVIDPAKIKVDVSGGQFAAPSGAIDAARQLARIQGRIGAPDFHLLVQACSVGETLGAIMRKFLPPEEVNAMKRSRAELVTTYVGWRIKYALGLVAFHLGLFGSSEHDQARASFYRSFNSMSVDRSPTERCGER